MQPGEAGQRAERLFRSLLDQTVDVDHALAKLAAANKSSMSLKLKVDRR